MKKRQRFYFILFMLACFSAALALTLYALKDNISLFYPPARVALEKPAGIFRLGGMVKKGSLKKRRADLFVHFVVTDFEAEVPVEYKGILPDLFREGQGVVAEGHMDARGVFIARTLLAKHDEKYMPPEVARSLKDKK